MNRFLLRNDGGVFKGMKKMFVLPFRVNSFLVDLKQHKAYNLGGTIYPFDVGGLQKILRAFVGFV